MHAASSSRFLSAVFVNWDFVNFSPDLSLELFSLGERTTPGLVSSWISWSKDCSISNSDTTCTDLSTQLLQQ